MKSKIYRYYIAIFTILISVIIISIVYNKNKYVQDDNIEEVLVQQPEEKNKTDRSYNTYTATIEFDKNLSTFFGNEIINYVHEFEQSTDTIFLRLGLNEYNSSLNRHSDDKADKSAQYGDNSIVIKSVKVTGQQVRFRQYNTSLAIQLEETLDKDEAVDILIEFEGKVPIINDYIGRAKKSIWLRDFLPRMRVYDNEEGWLSAGNFGKERYSYSETSKYKVTIIVSEEFDVITGTPYTNCLEENGKKKVTFDVGMVRDFGMYIGVPKNKKEFKTQQNKTLIIYSDNEIYLEDIGERADSLFGYYNDIFGTYPYDTFMIVDANSNYTISYPKMIIANFRKKEDLMSNMSKEIGHQWVPYIITHNTKEDAWLDYDLIEYMTIREKSSLHSIKKQLQEYQAHKEDKQYEVPYLDFAERLSRVEELLGEDLFRERLRHYYKTYAFKISDKKNFDKVMSKDYQYEKNKNK